MFRLVCYSVSEVIDILKNVRGAYLATDSHGDAYIIRGFDKICVSKEVFGYVIANYSITIGDI